MLNLLGSTYKLSPTFAGHDSNGSLMIQNICDVMLVYLMYMVLLRITLVSVSAA